MNPVLDVRNQRLKPEARRESVIHRDVGPALRDIEPRAQSTERERRHRQSGQHGQGVTDRRDVRKRCPEGIGREQAA